jgi:hypothetical protein
MKKILIGLLALGSISSFASDIRYHKDCKIKNNSYSITDQSGNFTDKSYESLLMKKGYVVVTSENETDELTDLLEFDAFFNIVDRVHTLMITGFTDELGNPLTISADSKKSAEKALNILPSCRIY